MVTWVHLHVKIMQNGTDCKPPNLKHCIVDLSFLLNRLCLFLSTWEQALYIF